MKMTIASLFTMLLLGCIKEHNDDTNSICDMGYYLSANIDGHIWYDGQCRQTYFAANQDGSNNSWDIGIYAMDTNNINTIIIDMYFLPKSGQRYYFNNAGSVVPSSGLVGIYIHTTNGIPFNKYSASGYVDIDTITENVVKGDFNFTARGDATDTSLSAISNGNFYVFYAGGNGRWTGP